jgi:hypothetical protein
MANGKLYRRDDTKDDAFTLIENDVPLMPGFNSEDDDCVLYIHSFGDKLAYWEPDHN